MKITISESFYPLFDKKARYLLMYGGRGSGKSEFAGRKIFKRSMEEGNHKFLIMRKVRKTLKESVIDVMLHILDDNKIKYNYNKTDREIVFHNVEGKKNIWLFEGMDDFGKIKSMKGVTSGWIEELTEFTEKEFREVDLIIRESNGCYQQLMGTFNPDEVEAEWIKDRFYFDEKPYTGKGKDEDSYIHYSSVQDNPIQEVRDRYLDILNKIKDPVYSKIYRWGLWALAKGFIFDWDVVDLPTDNWGWYDEIFYGGDFGYSIDPAALIRIYRKSNEYWVQEVIYETELTNIQLGKRMRTLDIIGAESFWDSAEPKSIQELYDLGINAQPALKGPDSVKAGIDFLKEQKIHIVKGSENILKERKKYKWKTDKNGKSLKVPTDYMNHAMDAIRYGIYTHSHINVEPYVVVGG